LKDIVVLRHDDDIIYQSIGGFDHDGRRFNELDDPNRRPVLLAINLVGLRGKRLPCSTITCIIDSAIATKPMTLT
jgi:hypothetical protein